MKATVQTRVFISMTPDEARAACTDALDLQLALRQGLTQLDGIPVSQLIVEHSGKRSPLQLPAPKSGQSKKRKIYTKECPHCHAQRSAIGYARHVAYCAAKHAELVPAPA